ncbi:MAG: putative sulfate exporter family transporter, partial [Ginsengibacter sp.]
MQSVEVKPEKIINIPEKKMEWKKIIFITAIILCLTPLVSPPIALLIGFAIAQFVGHPYIHLNSKAISFLLKFSVIGLGFGMNVHSAMLAGREGLLFTVA